MTSDKSEKQTPIVKTELVKDATTDVTKVTTLDRQKMYLISKDYVWFETNVKLSGTVDSLMTPDVEFVENIFQVVTPAKDGGFNTSIYCLTHTLKGSDTEVKDAFWLEDKDLSKVKGQYLDFTEVYTKLQEANCPKPHTQYATLRQRVGPKAANPQWIFGNEKVGMVFVDALTGAVTTQNPVF